MPKYYYRVELDVMEKIYFEHTQTNFFKNPNARNKFNAELLVIADNEQESERIREGMTDTRMWILDRVED